MVKPQDLVKLPQDKLQKINNPKSTREEFERFRNLVNSKLNKN